jgi:galactoside O-acetyltransferase
MDIESSTFDFTSEYLDSEELRNLGFLQVGDNVRISRNCTIAGVENVKIGSNVRIDSYNVIIARRGTLSIGNNVHIEPSSSLVAHFGITIGNFCTLSHGVRLFTASADYGGNYFTNSFPNPKFQVPISGSIVLEDHVIVGANSVVLPSTTLSEGCAIGAMSLVRHSVEPWKIYGGNPLRFIRDRNRNIKEIGNALEMEFD